MIPLIIAIILLSISILVSRQFLLMKEWFLWACMLVNTYLKEDTDNNKNKLLRMAGKKRFPIVIRTIPERPFEWFINYVEKDLRDTDHTMKNYTRLVRGIALYDKDYKYLNSLIDDVGKKEKA